jgi:hypothetical protein
MGNRLTNTTVAQGEVVLGLTASRRATGVARPQRYSVATYGRTILDGSTILSNSASVT